MKRVGIDIGGTFTDIVVYDERTFALERRKVLTTTAPQEGFLAALKEAGVSTDEIAYLIHGTTLVTNLIIERKGARVGLVTTRGFRDVLEIMRATRERPYDLHWHQPRPVIPRHLRLEVTERVSAQGEVLVPLDEAELRAAVRTLLAARVDALAVCFLHSYANPIHEERARTILAELAPHVPVSISSEVCREIREYERTSTTVLNSYAMPGVDRYISALDRALPTRQGVKYMNSEGGLLPSDEARRLPVRLCLSGPAGGVLASVFLAETVGLADVIAMDMGGTSLDVCVIRKGRPQLTSTLYVQWGIPIRTPAIDVKTIGAGGGSIVWIDEGGALRVGPQSAAASPGPACYARGGTDCTVTDANMILGILNQESFLGGLLKVDRGRSFEAIMPIARHFRMSPVEAAEGVYRVVNANMAAAIRQVTVEKGIDPRDFTLIPFGGAGGQHAVAVAREIGIQRVLIPVAPSVFSAFGMITAHMRHSRSQTLMQPLTEVTLAGATDLFAELEREPLALLKQQEGIIGIDVVRTADLRYQKQAHEISVELRPDDSAADVVTRFEQRHREAYGTVLGDPITVVTFRTTVVGLVPRPTLGRESRGAAGGPQAYRHAPIHPNPTPIPVVRRPDLRAGMIVHAPCLVEEVDSVHYLPPGCRGEVDEWLNIHIDTGEA